jgi:uncharacterized membrane protein YedE/YeeE
MSSTNNTQQTASGQKRTAKLNGPVFLVLGAVFGFLLSRAGATTYDFYAKLFLFQDFQLVWVIAVAAGLGVLGLGIPGKVLGSNPKYQPKSILTKQLLSYKGKPYKQELVPGSILFGLGWGLAGACPGTALAMVGEGKLGSIFTIIGFFVGTYTYGWVQSKKNF